ARAEPTGDGVRADDVRWLACPRCRAKLAYRGSVQRNGLIDDGRIVCAACPAAWPVRNGLAHLYDEEQVQGIDRWMRLAYDYLGRLHEPGVRYLLPLLQLEGVSRDAYMRRVELGK